MTKCQECRTDNPADSAFCQNCGKPIKAAGDSGPALQTLSGLETIGGGETLPRHAYPKDEVAMLEPGAVFADRYTIETRIGIGGMGVVYRARDKIGDRLVALKLIRPDRLAGENAVSRLIAEGVLTQDIRHKNIVGVYHVDQLKGQPFVSMEFVDGVSLREWLRKQKRARAEVGIMVAARIINEVLAGLQAAHDMGVVHRDLKPENIMLTAEPREDAAPLKILDFGIARVEARQAASGTGREGTVEYMAPEQITDADSAGPEADFYSLSIIFYELLVGVLPKGGWQPPSSGRSDVPARVDALIESGLQNRTASRPQSAAEYREKLDAAIGGAPVRRDDPGKIEPVVDRDEQPKKKRNWPMIGGAAFGGVLVLGVIGNALEEDNPPPPPPPPGSIYPQLSGQWLVGNGAGIAMNVDDKGVFSGTGGASDGTSFTIQGAFSGTGANYTVTNATGTLGGQLAWDGRGCHLDFRTVYPNGAIAVQGQFHVNHPPGGPCPAGWGANEP